MRIGILGAARIVPSALIGPARKLDGVEVGAVAARDPTRARRFAQKHGIPRVHERYDDLVEDPTLDAIYNPLPNHLHGTWTLAALRAGKHVLCEKPLAANGDEAQAMAEAAATSGRILMEAFHYRYHPVFRRMETLVTEGRLGPLRRLEAHFCTPLLRLGDIRYRYDLAGGAFMDLGCYAVHMLRTLAGCEPRVIGARAATLRAHVDRRMEADLVFPVSPYAREHGPVRARAVCSFFSSTLLRIVLVAEFEKGEVRLLNPILPHLFHRLRIRSGDSRQTERYPGESSYVHQLQAFQEAVMTGTPPLTNGSDGWANMRVIDAVYTAAGLPLRQPAPPPTAESL